MSKKNKSIITKSISEKIIDNNKYLLGLNGTILGFTIVSVVFSEKYAVSGLSLFQFLLVIPSILIMTVILFHFEEKFIKRVSYTAYVIEILSWIFAALILLLAIIV